MTSTFGLLIFNKVLSFCISCSWKTRQRPTLPRLKTKYHRRYRLSRPSSEWDRVGHLCHNHLVIQTHEMRTARLQLDCSGGKAQRHPRPNTHFYKVLIISLCILVLLARSRRIGVCLYVRLIKPIELLVPVSFTHYCASTPGLSTWWSSTVLKRILVSRGASRLDAFSGYPFRT